MRGICRGLVQAHQHGLVHRSLTPRNVLVSPDFATVKVSDLGATRFETAAPSLTATLGTGAIHLGALYYLAPEMLEGTGAADARADLYSAGVIFHEMLTGRAPGPRFGLPSQIDPALSPEIDVVALRCLARRPDERYASAGDLLAALERLEETLRLRTLTEIRGISQAGSRLGGGKAGEAGKSPCSSTPASRCWRWPRSRRPSGGWRGRAGPPQRPAAGAFLLPVLGGGREGGAPYRNASLFARCERPS